MLQLSEQFLPPSQGFICRQVHNICGVGYWLGCPDRQKNLWHCWISDNHVRVYYLKQFVSETEATQALQDFMSAEDF